MQPRKLSGPALLALFAVAVFISSTPRAVAEPLRWKLEKGQKLHRNVVHQMTMKMEGGPAGDTKLASDMVWEVQDVNQEGDAVILQTFDRIQVKMTSPFGVMEYDSKAEAPAAVVIGPIYKAIADGKYQITMTPRGEVKDVKIPPEVLGAITGGANAENDAAGEKSAVIALKAMLTRGVLELPAEELKPGTEWTVRTSEPNPPLGDVSIETLYRYEGTKDVDGKTMSSIQPVQKMEFAKSEIVQVTMKDQETKGEVLFDQEAGRLHSLSIDQTSKLEITAAGQSAPGTIQQKVEVKLTPAEEKAESEEAKEESQK